MTELVVESFLVGALHPYHRNPRRGDVTAIAASLRRRGQYRPIVVNVGSKTGRPMEILAGNHTWAAARSLGWESIEATTVDVDDDGAAQIVLADNRLSDLGGYDDVDLAAVLREVSDLDGTGFSDAEVSSLLAAGEDPVSLTDADDAPPLPESDPVTHVGEIWTLGQNRLVVGSSTDAALVQQAFGEERADCIWTDPPYGVSYVGKTKKALRIDNDGADEAVEVTRKAVAVSIGVARPGAALYMCHADAFRVPLQTALEAGGVKLRQTLVWVKDRFVLGHADYQWQHEPILSGVVDPEGTVPEEDWSPVAYGFLPGGDGRLGRGGEHWTGDNRQTTVFQVKRPKASREHPTMKPVELIEDMISNSCPPGGIVFDPFAGSGSTLIAAYRQRMRAVVVELDPRYCDVICERFQRHTGIVPELDGVTHDFEASS